MILSGVVVVLVISWGFGLVLIGQDFSYNVEVVGISFLHLVIAISSFEILNVEFTAITCLAKLLFALLLTGALVLNYIIGLLLLVFLTIFTSFYVIIIISQLL